MSDSLPLPTAPGRIVDIIRDRIKYSAATWRDAGKLRELADNQWTPAPVRHEAKTLYNRIAVETAAAAILLTEFALDDAERTAGDIVTLEVIAGAKELPTGLRHAAARLVSDSP